MGWWSPCRQSTPRSASSSLPPPAFPPNTNHATVSILTFFWTQSTLQSALVIIIIMYIYHAPNVIIIIMFLTFWHSLEHITLQSASSSLPLLAFPLNTKHTRVSIPPFYWTQSIPHPVLCHFPEHKAHQYQHSTIHLNSKQTHSQQSAFLLNTKHTTLSILPFFWTQSISQPAFRLSL